MTPSEASETHILLIHGINDTSIIFDTLEAYLQAQGWHTHAIDLIPSSGILPLENLAEQLRTYERTHMPQNCPFILVGFSMGGIISRYYLQRLGGLRRVKQFISIGSPHHGSLWANLHLFPGARQMGVNSPFLADLNRDADCLQQVNHVSIWTPYDMMIVPYTSSIINHGFNQKIPALTHNWLLSDPRSLKTIHYICEESTQP